MKQHPLVGAWRVKTAGAPFSYHMFVFHSDGTMHQSNPPAGNTDTSDTAGLGVWGEKDGKLVARFEEYRLDFKDGSVTRGAIDFNLSIERDGLKGDWALTVYDAESDKYLRGPLEGGLTGQRVTLP